MQSRDDVTPSAWLRFRRPRVWSNAELRRFSELFAGPVVNVSGWKDADKEGGTYREYFSRCDEYYITNPASGGHGLQGYDNEFALDLEEDVPSELAGRFDVVFNHTTLEHIYECRKAFATFCKMSKDVVIVVVPYIQQIHHCDDYNDYWRFTPLSMKRMYEENGLNLRYCSANGSDACSVYLFCLGYRKRTWDPFIPARFDVYIDDEIGNTQDNVIGSNVIRDRK